MERKEVLKLGSWEDGKIRSFEDRKMGKEEMKFQMTNNKTQITQMIRRPGDKGMGGQGD